MHFPQSPLLALLVLFLLAFTALALPRAHHAALADGAREQGIARSTTRGLSSTESLALIWNAQTEEAEKKQRGRDATQGDTGGEGAVERTWRGIKGWLKSQGEDWEIKIAGIVEAAEAGTGDDGELEDL